MKNIGKSNTVEYVYFRFVIWNGVKLHNTSKLVRFSFGQLLNKSLIQSFTFQRYFPNKIKRNIALGILTGQLSVMKIQKKNSIFKLLTKEK